MKYALLPYVARQTFRTVHHEMEQSANSTRTFVLRLAKFNESLYGSEVTAFPVSVVSFSGYISYTEQQIGRSYEGFDNKKKNRDHVWQRSSIFYVAGLSAG